MTKKFIYKTFEFQFFALWIFAVIIPKSLFTAIFVMEILFFATVTAFNIRKIRNILFASKQGFRTSMAFIAFFFVAAIMLILSYRNIPKYWHIFNLPFEKQFVFRHFMVVAELFLSIGLGYTMMRTGRLFELKRKHLIVFSVILALVMVYNRNYVIFLGGLFVATISLLSLKMNNKFILVFIPFVMISHSAYIIASAVMLSLIFLRNPAKKFFSIAPARKIVTILLLIAFIIYFAWDHIFAMILKDENSLWRLIVWQNELESFLRTDCTGVGFGSAYVTTDIYALVDNYNMYLDRDGTMYERLFLVANHNSIINMFYRMGLLGGILFFIWNILICSMCFISFKKRLLGEHNEYCWWAFTNYMYNLMIIAMNPGMEMMQFAINYTFSLGIMFAIIFNSNETIRKKQAIKERAILLSIWLSKDSSPLMRK